MDVVYDTEHEVVCRDTDKLISFIRTHYSDSLFCYSAVCPCVQTSASSSSRSVPKKTPASARREINAATSELLMKVRGILILMTLDMRGI